MENKQTAVEWLVEKLAGKHNEFQALTFYYEHKEEIEKAKAIEEEQRCKHCVVAMTKEEPNEEAIKEAFERFKRTPMIFVPDEIVYSEQEAFDLLLRAKVETATMYYEEMKEWFEKVKKK
jgi:hypothetical protein